MNEVTETVAKIEVRCRVEKSLLGLRTYFLRRRDRKREVGCACVRVCVRIKKGSRG
jgi:hypothetical protein